MGGRVDRQALVAALRAVSGVADADVAPDDSGDLGTLRLDLEPGADEASVATTVRMVLREQFGLGVDNDRVQLVEVEAPADDDAVAPDEEPPLAKQVASQLSEDYAVSLPEQRSAYRPAISKMHLVATGLDVNASVTLAAGDRTATGEAHGLASQGGVHRAVAVATLRAVEGLIGGSARLELEHLDVVPMGNERTVVVLLTLLTDRGSEPLTGAAAVRDDVRQAVIRATLDALNRRLELFLSQV